MYKLSVPLHMATLTEKTLPTYIEILKKCKVNRVFLCGMGESVSENCAIYHRKEFIKQAIKTLKENGFEAGIWINSLGHGKVLTHQTEEETGGFSYAPIIGSDGAVGAYSFCPSDKKFADAYMKAIKEFAECKPDLIQLDDDFRFISRATYRVGCFCEYHLKEFYKKVGEEVPREEIEKLIYSGGKNKYRTAYLELMSKSLTEFAQKVRNAVNEVDENIRLSACCVDEMWSFDKKHPERIIKAFSGNTKPFLRISGAPYHNGGTIIDATEMARVQFNWLKDYDVESFSEGDVYPRPRYNVPSKYLELYEYILLADGKSNGSLNYMFDYSQGPDYETGYADRYIHNEKHRDGIRELFKDKTVTGIRTYNVPSKVENWDIPDEPCDVKICSFINKRNTESPSCYHLAYNSISTTFGNSCYPVFLVGENAKYITEEELKNGAIIDIPAAKILNKRGIDTGLLEEEPATFDGEFYIEEKDTIRNLGDKALKKIKCSEKAKVLTRFLPDNTPASYIYENEKGFKFYVLAHDACYLNGASFHFQNLKCPNYLVNYYRQKHLVEISEWLGGKKLPAVCLKNPRLYMLTSKNENAMSVLMVNIFPDDVLSPEIKLDKEYKEIKFVNCSGELKGDKVYLSDITPYGFAAFEVK